MKCLQSRRVCRVLAVLLNPFFARNLGKDYAQPLDCAPDKLADRRGAGLQSRFTRLGEPAPLFPRKDVSR